MSSKRKFVMLMFVLSLCGLLLFSAGCNSNTNQPATDQQPTNGQTEGNQKASTGLPAMMTWTAYDTSGAGYVQASAIANALTTNLGTKIRIIPSGTSVGRMLPLQAGTARYAYLADEAYFASEGIEEFAANSWGPQDLRVILQHPATIVCAVTKESGIKKIEDLRGKRVAWVIGGSTLNVKGEGMLAFGGLTWDDVIKVEVPSYASGLQGLNEGKVDAIIGSPNAAPLHELAASSKGVSYPEYPAADKEGWERMLKVAPWVFPFKEDLGAGLVKGQPLELVGYSYPQIVTYANTPAEEVYELIKAIDENYNFYKDTDILMPFWELSISGRSPAGAPFHEGAIKYLKEKGVWTAEDDQWNNERVARLDRILKAWDETIEEASNQGISEKQFPQFWLEKRAAVK